MFETEPESVTFTEIEFDGNSDGRQIFLQTKLKDNGNEGFEVTVLDGCNLWEGKITERDLDDQCETLKMDFNTYVKETAAALTRAIQTDMAFECLFKPLTGPKGRLTWKKVPEKNIKYNLGSVDLRKSMRPEETLSSIFTQCISSADSLRSQNLALQMDNERLTQDRQNALKRLEKCVKAKDELEKDLYSKFVLVLNSKKKKIRDLEEEIASQEDLAEPNQSSSPVAEPSNSHGRDRRHAASHTESPMEEEASAAFDVDTDEEETPTKRRAAQRAAAVPSKITESPLGLGDEDGDMVQKPVVVRRARKNVTAKKETPAKPVLPRVSSISCAEKADLGSRRSSLRKSGSNKSNKSSDNLDPDDLMDDF